MTAIKYLHHTPGRLRIKGRHFNCHGERARKAVFALQAMPGVDLVKLNAHAGSLTVHYDPAVHSQADLIAALEATGCLQAADVHAHVASNLAANPRRRAKASPVPSARHWSVSSRNAPRRV
jgi:hypothetical protein